MNVYVLLLAFVLVIIQAYFWASIKIKFKINGIWTMLASGICGFFIMRIAVTVFMN